LIKYISGC